MPAKARLALFALLLLALAGGAFFWIERPAGGPEGATAAGPGSPPVVARDGADPIAIDEAAARATATVLRTVEAAQLVLLPVDREGQPLELGGAARLTYRSTHRGEHRWRTQRSSEDGSFALELPPDRHDGTRLRLYQVERGSELLLPLQPELGALQPGERELRLVPGGLAIRAFDAETELPLARFEVLVVSEDQRLSAVPREGQFPAEVRSRAATVDGRQGLALLEEGALFGNSLWVCAEGYVPQVIAPPPPGALGRSLRMYLERPAHVVLATAQPETWDGLRAVSRVGQKVHAATTLAATDFVDGRARVPVSRWSGSLELRLDAIPALSLEEPRRLLPLQMPFPLVDGVPTFDLDALLNVGGPFATLSGTVRDVPEDLDLDGQFFSIRPWRRSEADVQGSGPNEQGGRLFTEGEDPGTWTWGPIDIGPGDWVVGVPFLGLGECVELSPGESLRLGWSLAAGLVEPQFEIVDAETGETPRGMAFRYAIPGSASGPALPDDFPETAFMAFPSGRPLAAGRAVISVGAWGYRPHLERLQTYAGSLERRIELEPVRRLRILSAPRSGAPSKQVSLWWRPAESSPDGPNNWLCYSAAPTPLDEGSGRLQLDVKFWPTIPLEIEWFGPLEWPEAPRLPQTARIDPDGIVTIDLAE